MSPSPRVRCEDCDFAWYGATAAHGLSVVGSCPRCGGQLNFLDDDAMPAPREPLFRLRGVSPASVLGPPTRRSR